jgi:hypothetical protein
MFTSSFFASGQTCVTDALHFEVNKIYPPNSISKEKLKEVKTLIDLNPNYDASWVKKYISVEIAAQKKGKLIRVSGENDVLNKEQKELISMSDVGTDISANVKYLPENKLRDNDIKEINFTFSIDPETNAQFPGGEKAMLAYIKEKAVDKFPKECFTDYNLAVVKFEVDKTGQISNAQVFWASNDESVDALLLKTVKDMPNWIPAEYADGTKVKQEYVVTVGNHKNCSINLLNIHQD